jgi:hypothetical protein
VGLYLFYIPSGELRAAVELDAFILVHVYNSLAFGGSHLGLVPALILTELGSLPFAYSFKLLQFFFSSPYLLLFK